MTENYVAQLEKYKSEYAIRINPSNPCYPRFKTCQYFSLQQSISAILTYFYFGKLFVE